MRPIRRWVRRNAVVELYDLGYERRIHKRYHAAFSAQDEIEAYRRLTPLIRQVPRLRLPAAISEDAENHGLRREYVPGLTLHTLLLRSPQRVRAEHFPTLVQLFAAADSAKLPFDSDPTNFIVTPEGLVLIDPLVQTPLLEHPTIVIFAFGLVKAAIRTAWKPWRTVALVRLVSAILAEYEKVAVVPIKKLYEGLALYISHVIQWNRQDVPVEGFFLRLARLTLIIPFYRVIGSVARRAAARS